MYNITPKILRMAHFSTAVTDLVLSSYKPRPEREFLFRYGEMHILVKTQDENMFFIYAGRDCLITCKRERPINPALDDYNGIHHYFMVGNLVAHAQERQNLEKNGIQIFFEEN